MEKITKTTEELEELEAKSRNGNIVKECMDKINEIIDWINAQ
tara:strand:- start:612 stop:737 length:126 start_codon:yes stop_codon:yes gene_type:complete